ncbi:MAG: glycosyltransferase [Desulfurococcaceae archaeon]
MANICIYGTVFNNASWVEESIKSVWRPDAEIVIVDSYSTDGTWGKLLELRKDYNLKLYRYKCTRGLGRHIALCKCPEDSTTAYFDLDTVYNEAFHKVVEYSASTGLKILAAGTFAAKRELIICRGGWRDLNYGEDVEMVSRVGFNVAIPVIVGRNECIPAFILIRERRYGGLRRVTRASIDSLRGHATSLERLLINRSKRGALFYIPARLMGFYKNRNPDNATWLELASLTKSVRPRDVGIPERYFWFVATLTLLKKVGRGEEVVDALVSRLVDKPVLKLYLRGREIKIIYFKDREWMDKSILPLAERIGLLE